MISPYLREGPILCRPAECQPCRSCVPAWTHHPRVQGLGFRVQGLGIRVQGLGIRVQGLGFRVQGLGIRVQGLGIRV